MTAARLRRRYRSNADACCCVAGLVEETELAQLEHLLEQRSKRLYFQGLRAAGELPGRLAAQHPALAPLSDKARRHLLQVGGAGPSCCDAARDTCSPTLPTAKVLTHRRVSTLGRPSCHSSTARRSSDRLASCTIV